MKSSVTARFIRCHNFLIEKGIARNSSEIARTIGVHRQYLNRVVKGEGDATVSMIQQISEHYFINPNYLMLGEEPMRFNPLNKIAEFNISFLPVKAQAGYSEQCNNSVYLDELEKFWLPISQFEDGEFRCFEIEGESMEPNYYAREYVICSQVSMHYVEQVIKNDQVYIVITETDVLLKRVKNNIAKSKSLLLISDNTSYPPLEILLSEIKEIWRVDMKLSPTAILNKYIKMSNQDLELQSLREKVDSIARKLSETT